MCRAGGERRGNAQDRRRRKCRMLREYGDGTRCKCAHCGRFVTYRTLQVDRIMPGGSYAWQNVQPSCGKCNRARSNDPAWQYAGRVYNHAA